MVFSAHLYLVTNRRFSRAKFGNRKGGRAKISRGIDKQQHLITPVVILAKDGRGRKEQKKDKRKTT
jgi:hypothetical protein